MRSPSPLPPRPPCLVASLLPAGRGCVKMVQRRNSCVLPAQRAGADREIGHDLTPLGLLQWRSFMPARDLQAMLMHV